MSTVRHDWQKSEIAALMDKPFMSLVYEAQGVFRENFNENEIQLSRLLSIKTGSCPEDCGYCSQSGHHKTDIEKEKLLEMEKVLAEARAAKESGATRFCMGGAWRSPPKKAMPKLLEMVSQVKAMGLETCMTLGMLDKEDASALKEAGLDYYNHNIDTSPEYYNKIISTRQFQDRLDTIEEVRAAGINVCCGGIMGLGESREDRVSFLHTLATMKHHPESVPINKLIAVKGTPLEDQKELDSFEFVRSIACARIMMPKSHVRLTGGRGVMSDELQTLCFLAGANSIHLGDVLLTMKNPSEAKDSQLMEKLGLKAEIA